MALNPKHPEIAYRFKRTREDIAGLSISLECLEDLDRTIDQVFELLQQTGDERLLEDLCPYFGVIWPSARALSEQLAQEGRLNGKTVLEIGCGLALPSLVAAKLGAKVTATDFHPEVPRFLARNLELNAITELEYISLNWREQTLTGRGFDRILGSDILYEAYQPQHVARVLAEHLAPGGRALIADPGRPYLQSFTDELKKAGLESQLLPPRPQRPQEPPTLSNIFLLEITRD